MQLYTFESAPNPQRLALFMRYKGIDIPTQMVDIRAGEHLQEPYASKVPALTVPALVTDDGVVMTEVIGICHYLEALHPERPLLGTTALEKGQVAAWDHRLFTSVIEAVAEVLRNSSPAFKDRGLPGPIRLAQIPELAERGRYRLGEAWKQIDAELAHGGWLAGDHFSLADIDLLVCAGFSGWVKASPPDDLVHLHAHLARAQAELG